MFQFSSDVGRTVFDRERGIRGSIEQSRGNERGCGKERVGLTSWSRVERCRGCRGWNADG